MSRFFDTIKSAIFKEVDETPKQNAASPMHASPEQPVRKDMKISMAKCLL